jgi:Ca2+-binding EF-hand superfamily protein
MSLYGVGIDVEVKRIHMKMKLALSKRGGSGIECLRRIFAGMDKDCVGQVCKKSFQCALEEFGLFTKVTELQALQKFYGCFPDPQTGMLQRMDWVSFLNGFREPLSKTRFELVQATFAKFDTEGCGKVDKKSLAQGFDVSKYPDFYNGKCSREEIVGKFLQNFPGGASFVGGPFIVTLDAFIDYYTDLSVGITSDEYFS